ncbi:YceG family protein [Cellulosilyticum ruminicola]|uniref:YceG family protein n=1 Tax=Cellulosilyticum ruminicola TaxID=425254 RepID=UPI0006D08AF6|nr:YceG family protein [Cellulosilyticum ruminicola]
MFVHGKIQGLNDFFISLNQRTSKTVYFYRISGYASQIDEFIRKYYEAARRNGVIIEGKLPNPDEKNLAYYQEMMGMTFQMDRGFIEESLRKWLPRMNGTQRGNIADAMHNELEALQSAGKNENILKNAYIKFMCWLYYKFERIVNKLGENDIPKILYEGEVSSYELMLLSILAHAGCDIVLLQYEGDQKYLQLDQGSEKSNALVLSQMTAFPNTFNLRFIREKLQEASSRERLYGKALEIVGVTNTWTNEKGLEAIKISSGVRGDEKNHFYNCYYRINGVQDKLTYISELYHFNLALKNSERKVVIVEGEIMSPTVEEIAAIHRKNYMSKEQMLSDLAQNIQFTTGAQLRQLVMKSFIDVMLLEAEKPEMNLNKLMNKAVYVLCWLKRYEAQLFMNWRMPEVSCFIYMGTCKNDNEALFMKLLSRLPVDVLILNPSLNSRCCLEDCLLEEINYEYTLQVKQYPKEDNNVQMATVAHHAEAELDTLLYQDTGIYRNKQYMKANSITLKTMYEEIRILWPEELRCRQHFSTTLDLVNMPVIFSKVSGVRNKNVTQYWEEVKELIEEETYVVKEVPFIESAAFNPMKAYVNEFFKNGTLQKEKIKTHGHNPFDFLREEIQDYMLDKLSLLINQKLIKGTFENGTEYTIVATVLNLPKELLRMIQRFDFTKKNPKLIYIHTGEKLPSLEDAVLMTYLNLIGFDIVCFTPTGYQGIEKYFNKSLMEQHQIGEYMYDLQIPSLEKNSLNTLRAWSNKIFKRN